MPVVIAPVLVALTVVITAVVLEGLLKTHSSWLRGLLGFLFASHQSFWKRVLLYPVRVVAKGILYVEHAVMTAISHALAYSLRPITGLFNGLATIYEQLALHLGSFAEATYDAFNVLRHITVPRLIREAVLPVQKIALEARSLARDAEGRLDNAIGSFADALARTGIGVWTSFGSMLAGLVLFVHNLWQKVWLDVVPKLERAITVTIPHVENQVTGVLDDLYHTGIDSLDNIRTRLRDIEDFLGRLIGDPLAWVIGLLGSVAGLLALEGILTRIMPEFFCRNTRGVARKLCGFDEAWIAALLAGALGLLAVIDPVAIAEAALATETVIEPVIREVAS